jgi:hypothetical protein
MVTITLALAMAALAAGQDDLEGLEETAMRAAVATVAPSVVKIETIGGLERSWPATTAGCSCC